MDRNNYIAQFEQFIASLAKEPNPMTDERQQAFDKFILAGFPNKRSEAWQYTDLTPISKSKFDLLKKNGVQINKDVFNKLALSDNDRIVLVDGTIDFALSEFDDALTVKQLSDVLPIPNLSITSEASPFVALNHAYSNSGYYIELTDNLNADKPLHIINIITDHKKDVQLHQFNFIGIGRNSSVSVVEDHINLHSANIFGNTVNKVVLQENSNFKYATFQNFDHRNINLNHLFIEQAQDSNYAAQIITKNGSLIRNEIDIQINGENCDSNISGLGLLDSNDHIENYTNIIHNQPHCNSQQLFKYILKDSAEGVFNGLVKVQPGAQQTDSQQTNKNILLSKKALMNSNPQLEIYADDVQCSHGSATGELDQEAIFYLRSRGLDNETAKALLIEGFAREIIDQAGNESFHKRVTNDLLEWLVK